MAAVEAEQKMREEENQRRQFMQLFPFRVFPTWDALHADPWRERWTASEDFERMMKLREKEDSRKFATMGFVTGLAGEIRDDLDSIFGEASLAYSEVRNLEERLRQVIGPIPQLPYGEEGPSNWN